MTKDCLLNAISGIDDIYIAEYLNVRDALYRKGERKPRLPFKIAVVTAAVLVITVFATLIFGNERSPGSAWFVKQPDKFTGIKLNAPCCEYTSDLRHYIVFNELMLTNEAAGTEGYFICFRGRVDSDSFRFITEGEAALDVSLNFYQGSSDEDHILKFKKELSVALSDDGVRFGGEAAESKGDFTLVFSISENCFNLLRNGENDEYFSSAPITLLNIVTPCHNSPHNILCYFEDIKYSYIVDDAQSYKKGD